MLVAGDCGRCVSEYDSGDGGNVGWSRNSGYPSVMLVGTCHSSYYECW